MNSWNISSKELSSISLSDIEAFLAKNNWKSRREQNSKFIIFYNELFDNEDFNILVPDNSNYSDYFRFVSNLITTVSSIHNESPQKIFEIIRTIKKDILQIRILSRTNNISSLPLELAVKEVNSLKNLIAYSACSELSSRPYFEKITPVGEKHIKQCHFGHTFEGSFGFTINSPFEEDTQQYLFDVAKEPPFSRRVVERIIAGLLSVNESSSTSNPEIIINNYDKGLNGRMCEALLDMMVEQTQEIEFGVSWSSQLNPTSEAFKNKILLTPKSYEVIKIAADELKKIEPFKDTIIGRIVTLHSNRSPLIDEEFTRTAIIKHYFEGKTIEVKLDLDKDKYLKIYEAHGKGQTVEVTGKLFRKGITWRMFDIESVELYFEK